MTDRYIKAGRRYEHEKYGEVEVIRACTLVHFDVIDGIRRAELHDLFIGNTEQIGDD